MNIQKNLDALKNLRKPKAVIFDWDNTLANTWPLIHAAINVTMRAMNKDEWSYQKVKDTVHKSMRESFPEIFGDEWEKAGEVYKNAYRSTHLDDMKLLPGALELINKLQEKNILQFVVSNKIGSTLRKELKKLQIDDKFFSIIGSTDASFDKPNKAPVDLALSGSNIDSKKDHIWFIGDTIADIDCAFNSSAFPIVYGHENEISRTITPNVMDQNPIPLYFNHYELIKIIDSF